MDAEMQVRRSVAAVGAGADESSRVSEAVQGAGSGRRVYDIANATHGRADASRMSPGVMDAILLRALTPVFWSTTQLRHW